MGSDAGKDQATDFAGRLHQALQQRGKRASATAVAREFNLRYRGPAVTVHAVRKWLSGLSLPTQDKLQVLARWLDVNEEWLRWGSAQQAPAGQADTEPHAPSRRMNDSQKIWTTSEEASVLQDWKLLEPGNRRIVRSIMDVLLRDQKHEDR